MYYCMLIISSKTGRGKTKKKWVSCRQYIIGLWFLIYSDNLCILIGVFRPLMFRVIIGIVGLIPFVFITAFALLAFFVPILSLFFCGFNSVFHIIPLSLLLSILVTTILFFLFTFFSGCPRVCNVYLQPIQVHFQ